MINESPLSSMGLSTQGPMNTVYGIGALNSGFVNPGAIFSAVGQGLSNMASSPANAATQPSSSWFGWGDVFKKLTLDGFATTSAIMQQRFGGPQPGQYFQSREGVAYSLPQGVNATFATFPGSGTGLNLTTLLILGVGGIVLVSALKK